MFRRSTTISPRAFSLWKSTKSVACPRNSSTIVVGPADCLDISSFGRYELVIPADPHRVGVDHITPIKPPAWIERPSYANPAASERTATSSSNESTKEGPTRRTAMKAAAAIARLALAGAQALAKPGSTTRQIDDAVHRIIIEGSAYPSPLLYKGYPMSCCTSTNNVVAHGIPDDRPLEDGDIVNVDVTVYKHGWHADMSKTFLIGDVDEAGRALVQATKDALQQAISICGPGVPFREIGRQISAVAAMHQLSVCEELLGHGIGQKFHQPPWISHSENQDPGHMQVGDCFTIEPALIQGDNPRIWLLPDGWTLLTESGARSAQWEHTVLISSDGADVITKGE